MRVSHFFLPTLREAPTEAELISHKLMLRAGLIKKLGSGLYSWLPLGLRVMRKVEQIVREEMNRAGAVELLMPAIQPAELWQETGRWEVFGPQMLKIKDRHDRDFCFGPTHEEVITDIARQDIRSYRQLPLNLYQIQTKFRDEIRPRFGVMRAREFVMKDAYSFHTGLDDLKREYQNMYDTYSRIFDRLGLEYRPVAADTGAIGGTGSHEFHVLADSGEDAIAFCPDSGYAANIELAEAVAPETERAPAAQPMEKTSTPGKTTCEAVTAMLKLPLEKSVKALAVMHEDEMFMLLVRGDHQLNEIKASKLSGLDPFRFATDEEIQSRVGCRPGYIGPVGLPPEIRVIADRSVATMGDFVCGANEADFHYTGVNFGRDLPEPSLVADIRNVVAGDRSPDGKGTLEICRGIEVGHIFQLRTKYSEAMKCTFLDDAGKTQPMEMGCYGIGVSRIVAAAIEQGHDEKGIIWPLPMAPFAVAIAAIGYQRNEAVREAADALHQALTEAGIDVLLDDRGERPGVMFADIELIGIPYRITVGERGLKDGKVELYSRSSGESRETDLNSVVSQLKSDLWSES
ncbi:MAG: proline--tRNA ligase [Betaproteobacteria bacterium SG8_40]|jgi:prolyl-tRNA synthetase|nr:MAG: proline--tRNA ligase [Betaproteobacteria bacterium SG8_40]